MTRHPRIHQGSVFPCNWCKHVANRRDNWVAHLRLHTQVRPKTGGKPRVAFYPGGVIQYAEEMKKNQSRRRSGKLKNQQNSAGTICGGRGGMSRRDGPTGAVAIGGEVQGL